MNKPKETAETPYGRLDVAALSAAQESFDISKLLQMVDELDAVPGGAREEDGLRDMLLRLHGMPHTVINGAALSVPANEDMRTSSRWVSVGSWPHPNADSVWNVIGRIEGHPMLNPKVSPALFLQRDRW